jgi:hypothetical protein
MSAADVYLARAAALRSEARFHTGRAKRRFLERDGQPVLGTAEV